MSAVERLNEIDARAAAATEGPWMYGTAPHPESDKTPAEWFASGLRGQHPLYALWCAERPDGYGDADYVVPAVTGDGPKAGDNAVFIAHAREDVPALVAALRAVLAEHREITVADGRRVCSVCPTLLAFGRLDATIYPCPTVAAITSALDGTR